MKECGKGNLKDNVSIFNWMGANQRESYHTHKWISYGVITKY